MDPFIEQRDRLRRLAYRMTGTLSDADDVVQEAWLRWQAIDGAGVRDPVAYAIRTTTRVALDHLRRAKRRRERYVGQWLPEPVITDSPEDAALAEESLSLGLMRLLEALSPLERAVFVLREAHGMSYAQIGEVLDRNEPAVRQLAARARRHLGAGRKRYTVDAATQRALAQRFVAATASGDMEALLALLAPDVTLIADGGGKVRAPLLPVTGLDRVGRFLAAVAGRERERVVARIAAVNGAPAAVIVAGEAVEAVIAFDVADGLIQTIYLVADPDKLATMSRRTPRAASS